MSTKVDRSLIIKLIIFVAIALLGIWIMNNTYWAEETVSKSLSGEAETNPFYAAQKLTVALGAHSEWKHLLGDLPPNTAVIVLSDWNWDVIEQRRGRLQAWVEAGGRLIVDSTLILADNHFTEWSGLKYDFVASKDDEDEKSPSVPNKKKTTKLYTVNFREDDCESLPVSRSGDTRQIDLSTDHLSLCNIWHGRFITARNKVEWGLRDDHGWQVARVNIGKGSVTLFNALPYQYRGIVIGDHALLFVSATQLKHGDHVVFMKDENGVPLLKLIWLYGAPAVTLSLLLIAAALWRNGTRFGPMAAIRDGARRSLAEQIIGTGRFIVRFNGGQALHAATVRALVDAARQHIPHYDRLGMQERITALAAATNIDTDELNSAINHQGMRRAAELRHAITVLEHARRILNSKRPGKH